MPIVNRPIAKLAKIQCQVALSITGAVQTVATDEAKVHAQLLLCHLLIRLYLQATLRLMALLTKHPLSKIVARASKV